MMKNIYLGFKRCYDKNRSKTLLLHITIQISINISKSCLLQQLMVLYTYNHYNHNFPHHDITIFLQKKFLFKKCPTSYQIDQKYTLRLEEGSLKQNWENYQ